jgi:hypothetical protein
MDTHLTLRLRAGLLALSVAVSVTACGDNSPTGSAPRQTGSIGGGDIAAPDIVGTWKRSITFFDEFGFVNTIVQTWTFDQFGNAARIEVRANETLAEADTVITTGFWRFDGPLVVVNFLEPSPGQLRMDVLVQGNVMTLGGQEYVRVACCPTPR